MKCMTIVKINSIKYEDMAKAFTLSDVNTLRRNDRTVEIILEIRSFFKAIRL